MVSFQMEKRTVHAPEAEPENWDNTIRAIILVVNVTATDPNCNQIQVASADLCAGTPGQPVLHLLAEPALLPGGWLRIYSMGKAPNPTLQPAGGREAGATVRELIRGVEEGTAYYEVMCVHPMVSARPLIFQDERAEVRH